MANTLITQFNKILPATGLGQHRYKIEYLIIQQNNKQTDLPNTRRIL